MTLIAAKQCAGGDRGGALDVVVEAAQRVAVAVEHARGVALGEIFPLQHDVRPALGQRGDEFVDEAVVFLAAHALVPPADVERIVEIFLVVGADIEQDRQRGRRIDAAAGGVQRQLADRDAHAAGALIAEAENALAIGDDDDLGLVEQRIGEDLPDVVAVRDRQKQAARLAIQAAEGFAAGADGRRIDDRQQLFDVLAEQSVIERLVGVLQLAQEGIALQVGVKFAQHLHAATDLVVDVEHGEGQKPMQAEGGALLLGESGAFIQPRIGQQPVAEHFGRQREGVVLVGRIALQIERSRRRLKGTPSLARSRSPAAWGNYIASNSAHSREGGNPERQIRCLVKPGSPPPRGVNGN